MEGISLKPAGGIVSWRSPTWGAVGEETLKTPNVNWSVPQATGAEVCIELLKSTKIEEFCNMGVPMCW